MSQYRNWTVVSKKKDKLALVLANQNYDYVSDLAEPIPSAKRLETALKNLGIDVLRGYDGTKTQMNQIINEFAQKLKDYKVGFVFYLGHGCQIFGTDYILPVDMPLPSKAKDKEAVNFKAIDVDDLIMKIDRVNFNKPKVILLDACRNNPFITRKISNGKPIGTTRNSKIVYTTQKNSVVKDNNPYIKFFIEELQKRGYLEDILRNTYNKIIQHDSTQVPASYGQLNQKISFAENQDEDDKDSDIITYDLPNMVYVEGGTFTREWKDEFTERKYTHQVKVSSFQIARFEVTQGEWKAIMGSNPSKNKGCDKCPVENVSWEQVQVFISKLNAKTKLNYRLPTEAEWEFAARGGNKSRGFKYAGSNNIAEVAWYKNNANGKTRPVGEKAVNELGLFDMSGNVWEWCSDKFKMNYYQRCAAKGTIVNPKGPSIGAGRVAKGGAWSSSYNNPSVSSRLGGVTSANPSIGFRLCLSLSKRSK